MNTLYKNPFLIPKPLAIVDGELLYCIRHINPEQRFWGRTEPSANAVRYALTQYDADLMGAGDAGSILLWSRGDHTYLERTLPPQSAEREALGFILTRWFHARNHWMDLQLQPPTAARRQELSRRGLLRDTTTPTLLSEKEPPTCPSA